MKFTKMHGIGNDYIYVNCFEELVLDPSAVSRLVSDRHFGIGGDGLILIQPSDRADCRMEMYNADGSRGAMCGNAIRCVAKYVYDRGIAPRTELTIDTDSGLKYLSLSLKEGKVDQVRVNMGAPILVPSQIPILTDQESAVGIPLTVDGAVYPITGVSMGNPHAVVYLESEEALGNLEIEKIGPKFEHHPAFPDRINTEFVKVLDRHTVRMRVWERGSGETLACGTGACAVTVASILNGLTEEEITVRLLGGDLHIRWDRSENLVYMTGPAATVFDGEIQL